MTTLKKGLLGFNGMTESLSPALALFGMGSPSLAAVMAGTVFPLWVPQNYKELELLRQVYYGGVQHEIRKDVWPFLLGHYKFGMSKKEMEEVRGA